MARNLRRGVIISAVAAPSTLCIDDDTLAVFAEGALDAAARARVEAHLIRCDSCMEAVAAAALSLDPMGGAAEPVAPGLLGGRFELGVLIARGGMGVVHQGRDRVTGQKVAIKCLRSELLEGGDDLRQRFEREGEILRQLDHPNIVKMLSTVQDEERLHIVMEYVGGGCLRSLLRANPLPLPVARVVRIALELSDALARAHHLQVTHRDIKPENVLLAEDGTPKLSDFGLARVGGQGLTRTGMLLGTVSYQSPEALWGQEVDHRADIWALGITLYELLAGRRPFEGRHPAAVLTSILTQAVPSLSESRPELPPRLVQLIERMLDKNPTCRIGSMRQVGAELELIVQTLEPPVKASERKHSSRGSSQPPAASRREHNLPAPSGSWMGREAELLELSGLLGGAHTRLVTIVGPTGMGKTHLAIEAARRLARGMAPFRDLTFDSQNVALGVFFVDLGQLTSAEMIVFALARTIGFRLAPEVDPRRQLFEYLRSRSLLLVLDNFERLLDGAGIINELVAFAPRLRVLATSRKRMGLAAETLFPLAGLAAPAPGPARYAPEVVAASDAGQLFVTRAAELFPGFSLPERHAADVGRICRELQGSPLGIALAAAGLGGAEVGPSLVRVRQEVEHVELDSLPPAAPLRPSRIQSENQWALLDEERGEARAHLLQVDAEDTPERRRALHNVIRMAWGSLADRGRWLLRRMSVFPAGFHLEAARAVLEATEAELAGLCRTSLLQLDGTSGRYHLHDAVREYAAQQLSATPQEEEQGLQAFTRFYAAFLQARETALEGSHPGPAAVEIARELGNVRAAWHCMTQARHEPHLEQCIEAMYAFHLLEHSLSEGEAALEQAAASLAQAPLEPGSPRALLAGRALARRAALAAERGRHAQAVELARQACSWLEEGASEAELGRLLVTWALSLCQLGCVAEGSELGERGLELLRSASPRERARALAAVGAQRAWLQLEESRDQLRESVTVLRKTGDGKVAVQQAALALAAAELDIGNHREAVVLFTEALQDCEERGDRWLQAVCLQGLADAHRRLGEYPDAEAKARRELELVEDCYPFASGLAHARLGEILKEQARWKEAGASAQRALDSTNAFTCAVAKLQLADISSLQGETSEARRHWGDAVETFERLDIGRGLAEAWDGLGWAALEEEQHATAQQYFRQSGDLAAKLELRAQALSALAGYAASLAQSHQLASAAELAALVRAAPATEAKTRARRVDPLLRELQRLLPADELDAAIQRGESLDWKQALMEMA